jgi:hypothetical membrane protein
MVRARVKLLIQSPYEYDHNQQAGAMKSIDRVNVFTERHPFIGPLFWIASSQFFIIQFIVAAAYTAHYNVFNNTISDLGNTVCGAYAGRYVCSPLHDLMNASFIILGLTMIVGALLIFHGFRKSLGSFLGFSAMGLAGLGTILVGIFPENATGDLHFIGALLPFLIGNIGMVILGLSLQLPKLLRYYTVISGAMSLVALGFFITDNYLGLGIGGMERIVAHPQTLWLIIFGAYISQDRMRHRSD